MNNPPAIYVENLTKRFGKKTVVDHLTLTVNRGDIFGFLGPNGSGKTTSIRLLCGLLTPDEGTGHCLGYDIFTQSQEIKRNVGYMTQRFSFYEDLSIRENLEFIARIYQMKNRKQVVDGALERLGLSDRQQQLAGTLSGGWKQRMALAACMLHEPQLLLLDEPTAGVDPKARREFWDEIHLLADEGITVLVSTHYMDEAERCHRLAYIAEGALLAQGTPEALREESPLTTWTVTGDNTNLLAKALRKIPFIEQVVEFGNTVHISGVDSQHLTEVLAPFQHDVNQQWKVGKPRLEDIFIHLMRQKR